ncbi:VPLPA-CTERM sorting domain-containing protein [Methylococcus sp. EFPC2]|uniref:VPLPA-CTERM sorting domain-containing protein n=1 Tax=Methylococcus sp. EFPC2 TaxID=2812648 RepID=UPI001966EF4B|nr:VPLPA-CTERM sorting domain-containing protein [Methylococcus sp. EFPC2]QSA96854.1 VPLPA-CTERM sorting domain-containing protein [Methylococcus sp. EFPC2]
MNNIYKKFSWLLALAVFYSVSSDANTLYDSLGSAEDEALAVGVLGGDGKSEWVAHGFNTGNHGWDLGDITLNLNLPNGGAIATLAIYNGNPGQLGSTLVGTLSPLAALQNGHNTFAPAADIFLAPATTYWAKLSPSAGYLEWFGRTSGVLEGEIAVHLTNFDVTSSPSPLMLRIEGTPTLEAPVPIPAAVWLLGSGLAALFVARGRAKA